MEYKDYYRTLQVDKKASAKEIKKSFRKLARKYHPDVNPDDKSAENKFKEINEAYEVLSDPDKRDKYDRFGSEWQQFERGGGGAQDFDWSQWASRSGGHTQAQGMSQEEFERLFGQGGAGGLGGFSDFFETLFGGGGRSRNPSGGFGFGTKQDFSQPLSQRGQNIEHEIEISLDEAFSGTTRTLQWEDGRTIEAKIPKGVKNGSKVRLSGQGQSGYGGANAGDLYLKVKISPHHLFERDGDDLKITVRVDLFTALLGGTIEVSTLDRNVKLSIPPETANEKLFRLRGLGMPKLREPDLRGDLYAKIKILFPQDLSEEEKELVRKWNELRNKHK
jgi:curved DNA-binding protein